MARVKRRLATNITPEGEPVGFCGLTEDKKPPEAYFAEGDEEKLVPEIQSQPPRRGAGGWGEGGAFAPVAERSFEREEVGGVAERATIAGVTAVGPPRPTFLGGHNGSDEAECGPQGSGGRCRGKFGEIDANVVPQSRPRVERTGAFTDFPSEPSETLVSHREERLGGSDGGRIGVDGFRDTGAHMTVQPNGGDDRWRREGR